MNADQKWIDVALEELRLLQGVISRHEDHAFKLRGYLYLVVGALTTVRFAQTPRISLHGYVCACYGAVLVFFAIELIHRCYSGRAIRRAGQVERALRREQSYDGPQIGVSMQIKDVLKEGLGEVHYPAVTLHHVLLGLLIGVFWIVQEVA